MRDRVVQLTRNTRPLLDDRLAGGHVAFALGDPRALLAITDDAADEQHHCEHDDDEEAGAMLASRRRCARGENGRHDQRQAEDEAARRRPDRQRVQGPEVGDGIADELRVPEGAIERREDRHGRPHERRIAAANGDRCHDRRRDQRGPEPVMRSVTAEPDRELCANGEQGRQRPVEPHQVGPEAAQAGEPRVHHLKVNRGALSVIGRPADPAAPKDQPIG